MNAQRVSLSRESSAAAPHGLSHIDGGSERVKICKTFALALTGFIATVDAGLVRFYDSSAAFPVRTCRNRI